LNVKVADAAPPGKVIPVCVTVTVSVRGPVNPVAVVTFKVTVARFGLGCTGTPDEVTVIVAKPGSPEPVELRVPGDPASVVGVIVIAHRHAVGDGYRQRRVCRCHPAKDASATVVRSLLFMPVPPANLKSLDIPGKQHANLSYPFIINQVNNSCDGSGEPLVNKTDTPLGGHSVY